VYKGLALASDANGAFLYAADFHNGKIDVFDSSFNPVSQAGAFVDPSIPAGFAPFGVHFLAGNLYVTYAMQDDLKHDDVPGPGSGFINVFDPAGHLVKRFASNGPLNSPWGMALAPAGFGPFSGALLIGNFGDGRVNAFDPTSGAYLGALHDTQNNPLSIEGLWDIKFGNGGRGGDANRLYFTAGISGGGSVEDHGLFGSISAVPAVVISSVVDNGVAVTITWSGGTGPYLLQKKASLADTNWFDVLTTPSLYVTVPKDGPVGFYRVMENASTTVILSGGVLSYTINYTGLTDTAQAAHIHGPADTTHSAGVLFPLNGVSGTAGTLSGTQDLSANADWLTDIITGNAYANIHTPTNPGGEIRGQIILRY
jgi:hypothetical protein